MKKIVWIFMLAVTVAQATVNEIIPRLTSDDLNTQRLARLELMTLCSAASSPEASEAERKAICQEMCMIVSSGHSLIDVVEPMLSNLMRIGDSESVPTLVGLMNHKNEHIRDAARRALVLNPSKAAAQALEAQLKGGNMQSSPRETAGLIYGLGERKQEGVSKWIVGALNSSDADQFMAVAKTLALLNEDAGIDALKNQYAKEEGFRKLLVGDLLLTTHRPEVYALLIEKGQPKHLRAAAMTGWILSGDTSRATVVLASDDAALQLGVLEAGKQGADVGDAIAANIGNLPPHNQLKALAALEVCGSQKHSPAVESLLTSGDWFVRISAINAAIHIGSVDAVPVLVADGGKEARRALGQLNVDGVDAQLEKIAETGNDSKHRVTAIEALVIRGRADLISTFFKYGCEDDRSVSGAALKAIGNVGDISHVVPMVDLMIAKEASPVSREALLAIVQLIRTADDPAEAIEVLVVKMDEASFLSRANILKALSQTGNSAALKPLAEACRSSDQALQKTAIKSLAGWKSHNGLQTMLEIAADENTSLSNHVILMRGVTRIYAPMKGRGLKRERKSLERAVEICRRQEEKDMLQEKLNKLK